MVHECACGGAGWDVGLEPLSACLRSGRGDESYSPLEKVYKPYLREFDSLHQELNQRFPKLTFVRYTAAPKWPQPLRNLKRMLKGNYNIIERSQLI